MWCVPSPLYLLLYTFSSNSSKIKDGKAASKVRMVAISIALLLVGLGTPGFVNALVASARDANLFN
jgi:hypothetical protein